MGEEGGSEREKKRRKESENERSTQTHTHTQNERTNGRTLFEKVTTMRPCSLFYIPEV